MVIEKSDTFFSIYERLISKNMYKLAWSQFFFLNKLQFKISNFLAVLSIVSNWNYYLQFRCLNIFCCSFYYVILKLLLTIQMSQYAWLFLLLCYTEIITYNSDISIFFAVPPIVSHWNYYLLFRCLNMFCCSFYCVTLKLLLTIQMSQYFLLSLLLCYTEIITYNSVVSIFLAVPSIVLQ